ncbi:Nif3-like dinuclear metal center hexameric protein, partial [Candidatus Sumerlaeota bacterium]
MKISQFLKLIDRLAPFRLADSWDKVGLQLGDPERTISRILVCLEITPDVLAEAVRKSADLILSHHPLIFEPLESLRQDRPIDLLVIDLIKHDIAVVIAHTNLDRSPVGVNAALAELIGLDQRRLLIPGDPEPMSKYVVFVPISHEDEVIQAIHEGGGGVIGEYDHCTFRTPGLGTFRGREGATPVIGEPGRLEEIEEVRIETVVRQRFLRRVIAEVRRIHPYEEVAYDVLPIEGVSEEWGLGLIGLLPRRAKLKTFVGRLKNALGIDAVRFIGRDQEIGVFGGSANSVAQELLSCNFDILVTGELSHHPAQLALASGMN